MANLPEEVVMLKNSNMYLDCIYSITAQVKLWEPGSPGASFQN